MEREPEINIFVPERDIIVFKKNEVFLSVMSFPMRLKKDINKKAFLIKHLLLFWWHLIVLYPEVFDKVKQHFASY